MPRKPHTSARNPCNPATCPVVRGEAADARSTGCVCGGNVELAAVLASTLDPLVSISSFGIIQSASNSVESVLG